MFSSHDLVSLAACGPSANRNVLALAQTHQTYIRVAVGSVHIAIMIRDVLGFDGEVGPADLAQ